MKSLLVILVCLGFGFSGQAQDESKYKALLIYKFSEYIVWPDNPETVVVGLIGNSVVNEELLHFAKNRDRLKVINIQSPEDVKKCNILFVPASENANMSKYIVPIQFNSILVVSETKSQLRRGADISIYVESGKLKYTVNSASITSKSMIPTSKLAVLGNSI